MDAKALRKRREALEEDLNSINYDIATIERACSPHDWDPPQKELCKGFVEIDDSIGVGGIGDFGGKTKTQYTTKVRWSRSCRICGKIEYTEKLGIPKNTPQVPIFPGD